MDRREWIVNNVAKKGPQIWQPKIILLLGILPRGLFFLNFAFKYVRNMKNLLNIWRQPSPAILTCSSVQTLGGKMAFQNSKYFIKGDGMIKKKRGDLQIKRDLSQANVLCDFSLDHDQNQTENKIYKETRNIHQIFDDIVITVISPQMVIQFYSRFNEINTFSCFITDILK